MEKFKSEILSSGIKVASTGMDYKPFLLESSTGNCVYLTKSDINRLHGIAFPEKRRTGECSNTEVESMQEQHESFDINSPVVLNLSPEQKHEVILGCCETAGKVLLHTFYMCGLKDEIFTNILNEPTSDKFTLTFKKVTDVPDINVGEIAPTKAGDKYEEHTREVAKEMAKRIYTAWDSMHGTRLLIDEKMEDARIAVRLESEALTEVLTSLRYHENTIRGILNERCLIPAPETLVVDKDCTISVLERFCGKENVITQPGGSTKIKTANGVVRIDQDYVITKTAQGLCITPAPECDHNSLRHLGKKTCTDCGKIINSPSNEQ